jgi:hypothetical protein
MRTLSANSYIPSQFRSIVCVICLIATLVLTSARAQNPLTTTKFIAPATIATGSLPDKGIRAVAGYFNRDKKLDFYFSVNNSDSNSQRFYSEAVVNNGDGTFTSIPNETKATENLVGPFIAADLNSDGITDLVFYGPNSPLCAQQAVGDGTFKVQTCFKVDSAGSAVFAAVSGDFNGDGAIDLAVITSAGKLVIMLNDRSGALHSAFSYVLPAAPAGAWGPVLTAGDLNGDGRRDLVLTYGGPNGTVTPYVATTGGAFRKGSSRTVGGDVRAGAAVADVNHDGYGDLAVATATGTKIFLGHADASFTQASILTNRGVSLVAFADFNKDGAIDLAVAGTSPSFVSVYFGKNNGTFQNPTIYGTVDYPLSLIAADVNGTGNIDLATANYSDASLNIMRNDGTGHFIAAPVTSSPAATGIVAGDFNRDGKKDVAVVNTPTCKAPCHGTVTVFPGTGKNYFDPGIKYSIGMHGAAIATGDLNGDGILDLVVTNTVPGDSADISVLLGNVDGTFRPARNYIFGSLSNEVFLIDMNNDGKLDLVEDGGVALGKGDGTFSPLIHFPDGIDYDPGLHLAVGDLNGDGKQDLIASIPIDICGQTLQFLMGKAILQVLLGNGKGGFALGQEMGFESEPITSVAIGRLTKGGPQFVVYSAAGKCGTQSSDEYITYAAGYAFNADGTFGWNDYNFPVSYGGLIGGTAEIGPVTFADFNGDGNMEVGIGAIDKFVVAQGTENISFSDQSFATATLPLGLEPNFVANANGIAVADFNNDGRPDVVLTSGLGISRLYNITPRIP